MKISLALVATLATSASAIRLFTPNDFPVKTHEKDTLSLSGLITELHVPSLTSTHAHKPAPAPCHGTHPTPQPMNDPIRSLLSYLGIIPTKAQRSNERVDPYNPVIPKGRVEILPHDSADLIRILPIFDAQGDIKGHPVDPEHEWWKSGVEKWPHFWDPVVVIESGKEVRKYRQGAAIEPEQGRKWRSEEIARKYGDRYESYGDHHETLGDHRESHGDTFSGRLNSALSKLGPYESLAMAFVLGAGIGSIIHFVFMLFLISLRAMRCRRGMTREQRREARRARKAFRREGRIALREEEELPEYVPREGEDVVEKA